MGPHSLLALGCLALGVVAGFVMHRSDFCLAGAFRDLFLFRSVRRLRAIALLVAVTMLLFEAARLVGLLPSYPFPLLALPNGATVLGGALFGVGMVLAGGCVVGTLYRLGAGSAVSAVAFLGLLLGSAAYADLYPAWQRISAVTALGTIPRTVAEAIGVSPAWWVIVAVTGIGVGYWGWRGTRPFSAAPAARGALPLRKASLALAGVSAAVYMLTGMPLGITTCYAKMAAGIEQWIAPAHVASLAYFQSVPLDTTLPLLGLHLRGGPGPVWDGIATVQGTVILGIALGGLGSASLLGEFRPVFRVPPRQYASALIGGVLLALGSRFSAGCNVWYLMGGLPILATQSFLFLPGMVLGAWLGARVFTRLVLPEGQFPCADHDGRSGLTGAGGGTWNLSRSTSAAKSVRLPF